MIRIKNNTPAKLPSEYRELDYIQSTGSQYIDTGYTPVQNDEIEIKNVVCARVSGKQNAIFSAGTGTYQWKCYTAPLGATASVWYRYFTSSDVGIPTSYNLNNATTIKSNASGLHYGDVKVGTSNYGGAVNTTLRLLCGANGSNFATAKIGEVTIKSGNTIQRYMIPCYRISDNAAGMYDLANNVFYQNAGSGTFLMGNAVEGAARDININPAIFNLKSPRGYIQDKLFYGEAPAKYEQLVNYTMLYDRGDECTDVTGGWILYASTAYPCVRQKNADHLYIALSSGRGQYSGFDTQNTVDTQEYSQVMLFSTWTFTNKYWKGALAGYFDYCNIDFGTTNFTRKIDVKPCLKDSRQFRVEGHGGDSGRGTFLVYSIALVKDDDWSTLASIAGITASSISDILNNSTTLLSNKEAVDYMIYQCTGTFMLSAIQSSTFLTALNNSTYNTTIQANEHWNKFLSMVA